MHYCPVSKWYALFHGYLCTFVITTHSYDNTANSTRGQQTSAYFPPLNLKYKPCEAPNAEAFIDAA